MKNDFLTQKESDIIFRSMDNILKYHSGIQLTQILLDPDNCVMGPEKSISKKHIACLATDTLDTLSGFILEEALNVQRILSGKYSIPSLKKQ
jgi:hypothetical protein